MVKEDRKKIKIASASRASELLAAGRAAATPPPATGTGFGFGGFVGSQSLAEVKASFQQDGGGSPAEGQNFGSLDGQMAQHLRRLSKRDSTTKVKALQSMKGLVREQSAQELEAVLLPWAQMYPRLAMDNSRAVREESAAVLGAIAAGVGRSFAPYLKLLVGPWWMAQHDVQPEVARTAKAAFLRVFPGRKLQEALLFCQSQVLDFFDEILKATADSLGDPQRETPEELQRRHERVLASTLLAAAAVTDVLVSESEHAREDALHRMIALIQQPRFFKRVLASKSSTVRRSAYSFISQLSQRLPAALAGSVSAAAPHILGTFGDKDPGTHPDLWGMVLAFTRAFPAAWEAVDVRKSVLPKLLAFLSNGCYGSAPSSCPALYPLLTVMPRDLLGPEPSVLQQLLEAVWKAWKVSAGGGAAGSADAARAAAECFVECFKYGVAQAEVLAGEEASAFVDRLLSSPLASPVISAALTAEEPLGPAALAIVHNCIAALHTQDVATWKAEAAITHLGAAVVAQIKTFISSQQAAMSHVFKRTDTLILRLATTLDASSGPSLSSLHGKVIQPVMDALLSNEARSNDSSAPMELLAVLIQRFGNDASANGAASSGNAQEAAERNFTSTCATSLAAVATADVLLACIQRLPAPSTAFAAVFARLAIRERLQPSPMLSPGSSGEFGAPHRRNFELHMRRSSLEAHGSFIGSETADLGTELLASSFRPARMDAAAGSLLSYTQQHDVASDVLPLASHGHLRHALLLAQRLANLARQTNDPARAGDGMSVSAWRSASLDRVALELVQNHLLTGGSAAAQVLAQLVRGDEKASFLGDATLAIVLRQLHDIIAPVSVGGGRSPRRSLPDHLGSRTPALECVAECLFSLPVLGRTADSEVDRQAGEPGKPAGKSTPEGIPGDGEDAVAKGAARPKLKTLKSLTISEPASVLLEAEELGAGDGGGAVLRAVAGLLQTIVKAAWRQQLAHQSSERRGFGLNRRSGEQLQSPLNSQSSSEVHAATQLSALSIWDKGRSLGKLKSSIQQEARRTLRTCLVQTLEDTLNERLSQPGQDAGWELAMASIVKDVIDASCCTSEEAQAVVEPLIASRRAGWPRYVIHGGTTQNGVNGFASERESQHNREITHFAMAICQAVGWDKCLLHSAAEPRGWLAAELLCAAQADDSLARNSLASDGLSQEGATSLQDYLVRCGRQAEGEHATANGMDLLEDVLDRLWPTGGERVTDVSKTRAAALTSLLESVMAAKGEGLPAAVLRLCHRKFKAAELKDENSLTHVLPILAAAIRQSPVASAGTLEASGLSAFSERTMSSPAAQTSAVQAVTYQLDKATETVQALQLVATCFPIPSLDTSQMHSGSPAVDSNTRLTATAAERHLLCSLIERQLAGERAALASQAALRRQTGEQAGTSQIVDNPSLEQGDLTAQAESALGNLLASTLAYAWDDIAPPAWQGILKRVRDGVQRATVQLEEAAEQVSEAAVAAAARLGGGRAPEPSVAVALLQRLRRGVSERAASSVREAVVEVEEALADEARVDRLGRSPQAWLLCGAQLLKREHGLPEEVSDWSETRVLILSDAIRSLFALGTSAAVAASAGEAAETLLTHWASTLSPLYDAVAAMASTVLADDAVCAEGIQAANKWAEETGVDALSATLALALGEATPPCLQDFALALLLRPPLQSSLTLEAFNEDDADEAALEAKAEAEAKAESSGDSAAILVAAGLRPELAFALVPRDLDLETWDSDWEGPRSELLAWAVLLGHLLAKPGDSPERRSVSQALHDTHSLVPSLLTRLVQHLPLHSLPKASPGGAPKAALPASAAAAAATARAQGLAPRPWDFSRSMRELGAPKAGELGPQLPTALYRATLRALPASAHAWFQDLRDRGLAQAVEAYTVAQESSSIITDELAGVAGGAARGEMTDAGSVEFSTRAKHATREAVALVSLEDSAVLEMCIRLPQAWPLKAAEVECRRRMGVAENRLRKWLLSITAVLRSQNGALASALALWQRNCAREFAGVEECLICYNVISAAGGQLPRLECKTCHKKYHGGCLFKWFRSAAKSACPHCQSPW